MGSKNLGQEVWQNICAILSWHVDTYTINLMINASYETNILLHIIVFCMGGSKGITVLSLP